MIVLEKGNIRLSIERPEWGYKGTRFDWTGKVVQLWWNDISFCTTETKKGSPENEGCGFYNEFGMTDPVGYDYCKIGEFFPKIGVGLLCKESDEKYDFRHVYQLKPIEFSEVVDDDAVVFHCLNNDFDTAFFLKKKFTLTEDGFVIDYFLENVGNCELKTSEYAHNFIALAGKHISKNTRLSFHGKINKSQFNKGLSGKAIIVSDEHTIAWSKAPVGDFFYEKIAQPFKNGLNWTLENVQLGVGICESVDFNPTQINLWGRKHVVSPEVFKGINLQPGESDRWQRKYRVFMA